MPDLITLAAMEAYALGERAKWKDYVDLYFILRDHYSIKEIIDRMHAVFGDVSSEKLFRAQLSYFDGIDYREPVEFLPGFAVPDDTIKEELKKFSLSQ